MTTTQIMEQLALSLTPCDYFYPITLSCIVARHDGQKYALYFIYLFISYLVSWFICHLSWK